MVITVLGNGRGRSGACVRGKAYFLLLALVIIKSSYSKTSCKGIYIIYIKAYKTIPDMRTPSNRKF